MKDIWFYHYSAITVDGSGHVYHHNGTIAMNAKVMCDATYTDFSEKVFGVINQSIMAKKLDDFPIMTGLQATALISDLESHDFCLQNLTLLHHGEYDS